MISYMPVDLHKKKSDALVIHCADPRFQKAYRHVIDQLGKYHDLMVAPGASKAVVDDNKFIGNIKLLHSLHHFESVHIMDHIHCGAFGEIEDELKAHSDTLHRAADAISGALENIKVHIHLLGENSELPLSQQ